MVNQSVSVHDVDSYSPKADAVTQNCRWHCQLTVWALVDKPVVNQSVSVHDVELHSAKAGAVN